MVMSWIFTGMIAISILFALLTGRGSELAAAIPQGAQSGISLIISLAGSLCLWSGVGALMERIGFTHMLARFLRPFLHRIFPSAKEDAQLSGSLSANICANFLGLGNAATPAGIQAAQILSKGANGCANDQLCRLVVLNTASIQLIPSTVAAVRSGLGCASPFDILPAVWITSVCSVSAGLLAAFFLGKLWRK